VHGRTLDEAIGTCDGSSTPNQMRELLHRFVMVCRTMAYAHGRSIVHRNLKPEKIILGEYGETLVLDWGLATRLPDAGSAKSPHGGLAEEHPRHGSATDDVSAIPDTATLAPRQGASGRTEAFDAAADIQSLGEILHQILKGRPADIRASSGATAEQGRAGNPPRPASGRRRIPRALEAICLKAMERRSEERYSTANALAADVQAWLDDEPVTAHVESRFEQLCRWCRHHRAVLANGVLLLFALITIVSIVAAVVGRAQGRTKAAEVLAAQFARQAAEAEQQAREKELEASRRSDDAEQARAEAAEAIRKAVQAAWAADEARARVDQLEIDLKAKTEQTEELKKQIDQAREELSAAEARVAAETQRALDANRRVESLEAGAAALRREAEELRELSSQLTRLATASGEPRPLAPTAAEIAWEDFTEHGAAAFDVASSDKAFSILSRDVSRCCDGRCALRLDTLSGAEVTVAYPATRDAAWNLVARRHLTFAMWVDDARTSLRPGFPRVRIGRGSSWIQLEPQAHILGGTINTWTHVSVPIAGDSTWKRTDVNNPDLTCIDWIEICVAAENRGFAVWFDAVGIEPPLAVAPFNAMQARLYQQVWAEYLGVPLEVTNSIGMKLILIPPGEFDMGATQEEIDRSLREVVERRLPSDFLSFPPRMGPRHRVRITKPFYLGKHEVAKYEFRKFVEEAGYQTQAEKSPGSTLTWDWTASQFSYGTETWREPGIPQEDDHPVQCVSRSDANDFCAWLRAKEETVYRLPSEAEWEYACRAGTVTRFFTGDAEDSLEGFANLSDLSAMRVAPGRQTVFNWDDGYPFTSPIGTFKANGFGLHDMQGNAAEYCDDWHSRDYYNAAPLEDPSGPESGEGYSTRSGCWESWYVPEMMSSYRGAVPAHIVHRFFGFRLAKSCAATRHGRTVP
ncbi:MAG: hypothetical protein FJ276_19515, partial [Planctomycetes bacterium]|nr:hypothetical protein [Planctomycetota bacterium]